MTQSITDQSGFARRQADLVLLEDIVPTLGYDVGVFLENGDDFLTGRNHFIAQARHSLKKVGDE